MDSETVKNINCDGWQGIVVAKWSDTICKPGELIQNPNKIFKSEKGNITVLKEIQTSNGKTPFIVKKTVNKKFFKRFVNFFRTPKALHNFRLALRLERNDIPVASPIAAFWNSRENIYVTEYIQNSMNLYEVAYGRNKEIAENFSARKAVIGQVAQVIAKLHKANYWHRDSKAGNFIVYKENDAYNIKLIDLDGIKKNILKCQSKQNRTLANLAKTLIRFKSINMTDLYRGFVIYCGQMGIDDRNLKQLFRKIERMAVELRFLMILDDAGKFKVNEQ